MSPSNTEAKTWVQRGLVCQQAGDIAGADSAYNHALTLQPEQPAALQLLGLLARRGGDGERAEEFFRRSLRVEHRQPHVHNNLGNLLDSVGRTDEALNCFDDALDLEPRYAEAHYNRARVLRALGRSSDAAVAMELACANAPAAKAPWLQLQAQIEDDQGLPDQALATLDRALQLEPERPALLHNRATLLQRRHRHAEALAAHERALALGLDAADAHYNHGNTLQSLGRPADAMAAYRRALARQPMHALALYDLARLRWRMGDRDFDAELRHATLAEPASAVAPAVHAQLLWRAERHADAAAAYAMALQRGPQSAALHDGRARCLARLGQFQEANAAHQLALTMAPQDATLHCGYAATLLMARQPAAAAAQALLACEFAPDDAYATALLGLAWRLTGVEDAADAADAAREAWLNDTARLVRILDLAPPQGFDDMATFNHALAQELAALHWDRDAPLDQTLRHGTQTLGKIGRAHV